MDTVVLVVSERKRRNGLYTARYNGQVVVKGSKQPFFDSARKLVGRGLDPKARYVMRRSLDGPDDLISTLGEAASLTVRENDQVGPVLRPWTPYGGPQ